MPKGDQYILRVGQPGVLVPGTVPETTALPGSDDEGMQGGKREARGSPKKPRRSMDNDDHGISLESLKELFSEQAAKIHESQRLAMSEMMQNLRGELEGHSQSLRAELQVTEAKVDKVDVQMQDVLARVAKLESQGASGQGASASGRADDRHKFTIVYVGWERESSRKTILSQLAAAMDRLELTKLTDAPAFTTGPRRSLALQSFTIRPGECYTSMRNRMSVIIATLANTTVLLGDTDRKLWASFSRTKEARMNGDHAAWLCRIVRKASPDKEEWLELDYAAGAGWIAEAKVSSAIDPLPEGQKEHCLVDTAKENKPWIHIAKLSEVLKVSAKVLRQVAEDVKR